MSMSGVGRGPMLEKMTSGQAILRAREAPVDMSGFTWADARAALSGLPGGALNIAHEALDRHVAAGRGERLAIRWLAKNGRESDFSYADLTQLANKFANVLGELGLERGERVFTLLGRVPALYATALGTWKFGAVFSPLFSAFGPEPTSTPADRRRARAGDDRGVLQEESRAGARRPAQPSPRVDRWWRSGETMPQGRGP